MPLDKEAMRTYQRERRAKEREKEKEPAPKRRMRLDDNWIAKLPQAVKDQLLARMITRGK